MRYFLIIILLLISPLILSGESKKGDAQIGIMYGFYTSNGLFVTYNPLDHLGYRLSGYALGGTESYELKFSTLYTLHNSQNATFYLIGSYFISKVWDLSSFGNSDYDASYECGPDGCGDYGKDDDDTLKIKGLGVGAGYRFRGDEWGFFIEVQQNLLYVNNDVDYFLTLPSLAMGLYLDL